MLSAISDILSITKFFMDLRKDSQVASEQKKLDELQKDVEKIKGQMITKQIVYVLADKYNFGHNLSAQIFGEHLTHEDANKLLVYKIARAERLGYKETIDPGNFSFAPSDLIYSSFGTAGYVNNLRDGKSVVVFHADGDDRGRIFSVQWGIGHYYRTRMGGPSSFLGFPISDEHPTDQQGRKGASSRFEGGYVEYVPDHNCLNVYRSGTNGTKLVGNHRF